MKKTIFIALVVLFGFNNAQAQEEGIRFGVKGGLNIASLNFGKLGFSDGGSKVGFHIGGVVEIPLSKKLALQPELMYSAQGYKFDSVQSIGSEGGFFFPDSIETFNTKGTVALNYLNIPLMVKYYIIPGLSVEVGPQLGFLLSQEQEVESSGDATGGGSSSLTDKGKSVSSVDFGYNLGLGYQLPMGLFFQAHYNVGVTDVSFQDDISSHRVIQLSVGYKF